MTASSPQISVILPAYNAERHVEQAVRSILAQSFSDFELLVIDDGSTDNTAKKVERMGDARIRILRNGENRGIVFSLNRGIDESRGRYLARMDADDISVPRRLEKQIAFMETHPEVGLCGTWARKFIPWGPRWTQCAPDGPAVLKAELLFATPFVHPSAMMRRDTLREHALCYREEFRTAEDYRLWCEMALVSELAVVPEVLLRYRVSPSSVTGAVFFDRERLAQRREVLMRIWKDLLARTLGLTPDAEQLEAHAAFHDRKFGTISPERRSAAVRWLSLIEQANKESASFDACALEVVCEEHARSLETISPGDIVRRMIVHFGGR